MPGPIRYTPEAFKIVVDRINLYLESGYYQTAIDELLQIDPRFVRGCDRDAYHLLKGNCFWANRMWAEAIHAFKSVLDYTMRPNTLAKLIGCHQALIKEYDEKIKNLNEQGTDCIVRENVKEAHLHFASMQVLVEQRNDLIEQSVKLDRIAQYKRKLSKIKKQFEELTPQRIKQLLDDLEEHFSDIIDVDAEFRLFRAWLWKQQGRKDHELSELKKIPQEKYDRNVLCAFLAHYDRLGSTITDEYKARLFHYHLLRGELELSIQAFQAMLYNNNKRNAALCGINLCLAANDLIGLHFVYSSVIKFLSPDPEIQNYLISIYTSFMQNEMLFKAGEVLNHALKCFPKDGVINELYRKHYDEIVFEKISSQQHGLFNNPLSKTIAALDVVPLPSRSHFKNKI